MTTDGGAAKFRWAAILWLAGAIAYLSAEIFAARAFTPTFSIAHNFISDLGVSECGQVFKGRSICSPRCAVMNAAFVIEGLSFFLGALLFQRGTGARNTRFLICAGLFGLGMICIAVFHGAKAAEADGTFPLHVLGALVAIVSGNLAMVASTRSSTAAGLPTAYRRVAHVCVAVSLFAFVVLTLAQLLAITIVIGNGLWEHGILYPMLVWQAATAIGSYAASNRASFAR